MRIVRLCLLGVVLSGTTHAAPSARCVVVRRPTAQQREASAVDVERLLDDYEAKTNDKAAWPAALAAVFERFPLPSVNMLLALHHPAWSAPEQKLLAYVEATQQDPEDYAQPGAVAQVIQRIYQNLLPAVRDSTLLIVEARTLARRQEIASLDVHIGSEACAGNPIADVASYSVSWVDKGRRIIATVTPNRLLDGTDRCLAIEGDAIGPCNARLRPAETAPGTPPAAPLESSVRTVSSQYPKPPPFQPSIDYAIAVPGVVLAAAGFGLAVYARHQVEVHMERAEGGAEPKCQYERCLPSGMSEVTAARDWTTTFYVAGGVGLLGLGALLASGHRYYTQWLYPSAKRVNDQALFRAPTLVPIAAKRGVGLLMESRF